MSTGAGTLVRAPARYFRFLAHYHGAGALCWHANVFAVPPMLVLELSLGPLSSHGDRTLERVHAMAAVRDKSGRFLSHNIPHPDRHAKRHPLANFTVVVTHYHSQSSVGSYASALD
jgi:hypothetical protein